MSLELIFLRIKKKIGEIFLKTIKKTNDNLVVCDSPDIKYLITKWLEKGGWKFKDFTDILHCLNIKTPVKVCKADRENIKCITALKTEVLLTLCFGNFFELDIHVTDGGETKKYIISGNHEKGRTEIHAILRGRTIEENGKKLESKYYDFFCDRTLQIDSAHCLKVEIDEPSDLDEEPEIFVLRNCEEIEEYLLSLDNSLDVWQVYDTVMKMLDFSKDNIVNAYKILILHTETVGKEVKILGKVQMNYGTLEE